MSSGSFYTNLRLNLVKSFSFSQNQSQMRLPGANLFIEAGHVTRCGIKRHISLKMSTR